MSLWKALKEVADEYGPLESMSFDDLIQSAQAQHSTLERERIAAARRALRGEVAS